MNDKYYTPTIDEFYVGFEYEIRFNDVDNIWEKNIFTCDSKDSEYDSYFYISRWLEHSIRVKYLDKTDIESLGFVDLGSLWFFKEKCLTVNGENFLNCKIRKWNGTQIDVYVDYNDTDELQLIFRGSIKNKSELVKLLKMLGINE